MRQLLQNVSSGEISVEEVPPPVRRPGTMVIAARYSLISAGTERAVLRLGRSSLVSKARARPDLARKVLDTARAEGVLATYAKVRGRLEEPRELGYSLAGVVLEACEGAPAAPGELVACAGAGFACHAEVVAVPRLLCARVPAEVPAADAAYATVAAIALHGVRLAEVGLGDVVAVVGLGLVGQLTLELLAAAGCVAVGLDPDRQRVELACAAGFFATTDPSELERESARLTSGRGADGVLVTAASRSPEPLATGVRVARERAVVSVVGDVPIETSRAALFAKELRLVVSRSYGPGRYDPRYEEGGVDYPSGYVRWTEGRNLEEVLRLMAAGRLRPGRLTTHTFDLSDGPAAYALLEAEQPYMGILLRYAETVDRGMRSVEINAARPDRPRRARKGHLRLGVIGAGAYARGVLLPALPSGAEIVAVATATGPSARSAATRFGAQLATTDADSLLDHDGIDAVVVATRHDSHARYAARALEAGKHVFVEKPLAIDPAGLELVMRAADRSDGVLMVGFNRRFAPLASRLQATLKRRDPMMIAYRVSAGSVPREHWTHDPSIGGGRIIGEVCHFVDFACLLTGTTPLAVDARAVGGGAQPREDSVAATLSFPGGSVATILYTALGDPSLGKERAEVFAADAAAILDDFRTLSLHVSGRSQTYRSRRDKGHRAEMLAFVEACREGAQPWPVADMAAVTRVTFGIRDQIIGQPPDS